eukprot:TRINITY_DN6825_c0_g1_i1.p1 TRINITY_DN6825_c0_g1~~TRINITY_DN6825_c0_g1_i1.p1  ORF type:complete len:585 (-),score=111.91 TRINITY_DN6825_c0_g1_i1:35-1789(-)
MSDNDSDSADVFDNESSVIGDSHTFQISSGNEDGTHWIVFVNAYFIVVASILGTTTLEVPVSLAKSGFFPFLIEYTICLIVQCLVLLFMVELLQRGKMINETEFINQAMHGNVPLTEFDINNTNDDDDDDVDDLSDVVNTNTGSSSTEQNETDSNENSQPTSSIFSLPSVSMTATTSSPSSSYSDTLRGRISKLMPLTEPDLHTLAGMFLSPISRFFFEVSLIIYFVSTLVDYSIISSQSVAAMFGVETQYVFFLAPFTIIFAGVALVVPAKYGHPIISFFTLFKILLLVVMIFACISIGNLSNEDSHSSWFYLGRPFLIGTITLGGAVNIIPLLFSNVSLNKNDINKFMVVVVSALITVWFANLLWSFWILHIIPQDGVLSLETALSNNDPVSEPLIRLIHEEFPLYGWLSTVINVFRLFSLTIGFTVMTLAMKHVLDGFLRSFSMLLVRKEKDYETTSSSSNFEVIINRMFGFILYLSSTWKKALFYTIFFVLIFLFAQFSSEVLLGVLERGSSVFLNLEAGLFICLMLHNARTKYSGRIPVRLHKYIYRMRYIVGGYFGFAIFYDIITWLTKYITDQFPYL